MRSMVKCGAVTAVAFVNRGQNYVSAAKDESKGQN